MKRILFVLLAQVVFAVGHAQTDAVTNKEVRDYIAQNATKFLTVKGIELKPNLQMKTLLSQFLQKGWKKSEFFDLLYEKHGGYTLEGTFFNTNGCSIKVLPTHNQKDIVGIVGIDFPERDTFKLLKSEYDNLKESLSEKYVVLQSIESFDDKYVDETSSDGLKLLALSEDEATFRTYFGVSEEGTSPVLGYIVLSISHVYVNHSNSFHISVGYHTSDDVLEQLSSWDDL